MKTDDERKVVVLAIKEVIKSTKSYRAGQKLKVLKLLNKLVTGDELFAEQVAQTLARRLKNLAAYNLQDALENDSLESLLSRGQGIFNEKS